MAPKRNSDSIEKSDVKPAMVQVPNPEPIPYDVLRAKVKAKSCGPWADSWPWLKPARNVEVLERLLIVPARHVVEPAYNQNEWR